MVHQLDDNGTMAIVLPTGFVSWWCRRSHTPVFDKRENYLDAVIGLPANIFYGTSIPTCILVLKKNATIQITFCLLMPAFRKGKTQNVGVKRILTKSLVPTKTVYQKINTATLRH
jgi:type I restriction enzyme M protein